MGGIHVCVTMMYMLQVSNGQSAAHPLSLRILCHMFRTHVFHAHTMNIIHTHTYTGQAQTCKNG